MSYSEENGQVVLRMSREDYERVLMILGAATALCVTKGRIHFFGPDDVVGLLNRLNEGNPNYQPYEVSQK